MLRRVWTMATAVGIGFASTGCIGGSEILDSVEVAGGDSAVDSGLNSTIIDALTGGGNSAGEDRSKRDIAVRAADLLVAATDPSPTEQIAWDVVSAGLADGRKGLRDSIMALLFSPLADGFVAGLGGDE